MTFENKIMLSVGMLAILMGANIAGAPLLGIIVDAVLIGWAINNAIERRK